MNDALHRALLDAHAASDVAAMVARYTSAADASTDEDEEMFFLTHAYVFALEMGDPSAEDLRARLKAAGRVD
ncbi:MAG: hypothetical protein AAF092_00120 [Pseudomonadota bacterium]